MYVTPLKDADRLVPSEGEGRGVGSTRPAAETIPRRPVPFATWHIYDIVTLWLKYTYFHYQNHRFVLFYQRNKLLFIIHYSYLLNLNTYIF